MNNVLAGDSCRILARILTGVGLFEILGVVVALPVEQLNCR